jgi:hypothetical protein
MYKYKLMQYDLKFEFNSMLNGGNGKPVFDLNNSDLKFNSNVQTNLSYLSDKFGERFKIKNESIELTVKLFKCTIIANNLQFYKLQYDESNRTDIRASFAVWFYDPKTMELNNNCLIHHIRKTDKHSGSDIVNFVLDILQKLNVKTAILHDGATIDCNGTQLSLSYQKMLEKGQTYYMRFGFEPISLGHYSCEIPFNNKEEWWKLTKNLLDKINKISVKYMILFNEKLLKLIDDVKKNKNFDNIKIKYFMVPSIEPYDYYYEKSTNINSKIMELEKAANDIIKILTNTKILNFREYTIWLFNNKCEDYAVLDKYIFKNNIIQIKYKISDNDNIKINYEYAPLFRLLDSLMKNTYYAYYFS